MHKIPQELIVVDDSRNLKMLNILNSENETHSMVNWQCHLCLIG